MYKKRIYFSTLLLIALLGIVLSIVINTSLFYTHTFYIAIALTAIWYPRYAILVGVSLAMEHIIVEILIKHTDPASILARAAIIIFVSIMLSRILNMQQNYMKQINHLSYQNQHDILTSLHNRASFYDYPQSNPQMPVAIFFFDIDNLKFINDHYGHSVGDLLLIGMAEFLRGLITDNDTLARLGGDEFGILVPNCDQGSAEIFVQKIQSSLIDFNQNREEHLKLTFSTGYSICLSIDNFSDAIILADKNMYYEKMNKRMNIELKKF